MFKKNGVRFGALLVATTVACFGLGSLSAQADPPGSTHPELAGVGSDTIQDVTNGLASVIPLIGSYDALNPATGLAEGTIVTRTGGTAFDRPNGSGDGIKVLSRSTDNIDASIVANASNKWNKTPDTTWPAGAVNVDGTVDFSRSSDGPTNVGTDLSFISFAQDAVTYAYNGASDFPKNLAFGSSSDAVTKVSLYNIYQCRSPLTLADGVSVAGRYLYTDKQLNSVEIVPLVPQSGSGTRKFWSKAILGGDGSLAFGSCVTDRTNTVQEHNGTFLTGPGDVMPYSIAQYIAQGNHAAISAATSTTVAERRGLASLGNVEGAKPVTFVSGSPVMNPNFFSTLKRFVYFVVPSARLNTSDTSQVAQDTRTVFQSTLSGGVITTPSTVCAHPEIITQFGFATIGNACGVVQGTQGFTY